MGQAVLPVLKKKEEVINMAKVKYWVLEGVDKVVKGTYKMADKVQHKSNYVEGTDGTIYYISGSNKGYESQVDAEAAFSGGSQAKPKKTSTSGNKAIAKSANTAIAPKAPTSTKLVPGAYIGSDEVGKIEPLKQLIVVAVHVKADMFDKMRALGVDDSKKIPTKISKIGKILTGFDSFEQFESGKVYETEEYGLTYCPYILSNAEYNKYHEAGINANEVLTRIHNEANLRLLQHLEEAGIKISDIVIDDYMNGYGAKKFGEYLNENGYDKDKLTDKTGLKLTFETKADGTYKEIVGTASDICAYLDGLCQEYLNNKYGMELDYGNIVNHPSMGKRLRDSFKRIKEMDPDMSDVKHTKTYNDWKNM